MAADASGRYLRSRCRPRPRSARRPIQSPPAYLPVSLPRPVSASRLRAGPGEAVGVTEEMIRGVVHAFYGKVRPDPVLGPIFD